jgi:hypothetical protein
MRGLLSWEGLSKGRKAILRVCTKGVLEEVDTGHGIRRQ